MALEPADLTPRGPRDADADSDIDDGETLVGLFAEHHLSLVRTAFLLVRDTGRAEELVQDAFVDLNARRSRLGDRAAATAHLRRSVVDRSRRARRRLDLGRAREPRSELRDVGAGSRGGDEVWAQAVLAAVDALARPQREVLVLRAYGRLSDRETAAVLGVGVRTVRARGARALRALRPVLERSGPTGGAAREAGPGSAEQRLAEILDAEAEPIGPGPGALDLIRLRARGGPPAPRVVRVPAQPVVALSAALVLAAAVSLVAGLGPRGDTAPTPVADPPSSPGYQADPPRSQVDIYRVRLRDGSPVLSVESVSTSPPFRPRAALDALFGTVPLAAADHSALDDGRNIVGSTSETMDALVVDLDTADLSTRPATPALGRALVQAVVHTTQSAYDSELPVLVRLRGRPLTLYGVDTTKPLRAARLPEVRDLGIQMPRPGETLQSPVQLAANLPAGTYQWYVVDFQGNAVYTDGRSGSAGYGTFSADLPPGSYRAVVSGRSEPGGRRFRREVGFAVAVSSPAPSVPPVSNPPTTALSSVPVYWATTDGRYVAELRTARPAAELLADYVSVAPGSEVASRLGPATRVRSVTVGPETVVVDLARLDPRLGHGAPGLAARQAAAFAATVGSVAGRDRLVRVTLDGRPVELGGRSLLPASLPRRLVDQESGPYPQPAHEPGRAEVVGLSRNPAAPTTYVLYDAVTHEARSEGVVPGVDPRTGRFAFAVAAPAGRYRIAVHSTDIHERGWDDTAELVVR